MKKLIVLIVTLNLVLVVVQLVLANYRAGDGDQISRIETDIRSLSQDNSTLETKIYSAGSLSAINTSAISQNYRPVTIEQLGSPDLAVVTTQSLP